jgi:hypothetical protein
MMEDRDELAEDMAETVRICCNDQAPVVPCASSVCQPRVYVETWEGNFDLRFCPEGEAV